MKFRATYQKTSSGAQSPVRIVEQMTGREVGWINRYLDRESVRRLADRSLRIYAHNLLHFARWWASVHHTGEILERELADSTLLDYLRFQSALQPQPSGSTLRVNPPGPPSTPVSPLPIALSVTSFPMLLARSPVVFINASCSGGQWGLPAHGRR